MLFSTQLELQFRNTTFMTDTRDLTTLQNVLLSWPLLLNRPYSERWAGGSPLMNRKPLSRVCRSPLSYSS